MPTYNPPRLHPKLTQEGPRIPIEICLPEALIKSFTDNNIIIPAAIPGFALVDTGASITAVDVSMITQLGIAPMGFTDVHTPGSDQTVRQAVYPVGISFVGSGIPPLQFNMVLGSPLLNQGIIALLGRDILAASILVYNGRLGHFSLSF